MKSISHAIFQEAVNSQEAAIEKVLEGSPYPVAVTAVLSSTGARLSWWSVGDEPTGQFFEEADKMARERSNGDGFGIGVYGPSHKTCIEVAELVHAGMLALASDKVMGTL